MTPEDIGDIFQELEDALFAMAIRTMKHHENWEQEEGFQWTQWQAEQIQGLRAYRQNVTALTDYYFTLAKQGIEAYLRQAYRNSVDNAAETARTIMMQTGRLARFSQQFFGVNSKKLDVLINEAIQNIDTKRYAAINRMNTGYTDMLRKADIFAQSGSFTIPQAVDMAAKDFLSAGLNCVEYSNGNRVNIASYAEMALRTSSSEVTRQANGDVRDELGEYLVVSNVIGITCPICQKWQGKVLIDDVYASGKPDGKHKLVSQAKAAGFMHPNCRHQLYMYIPSLTEIADLPDTKITREKYKAEQQQRYQERQIRKYKRLRDGAMDPGNRQKYDARVKEWTQRHNEFLEEHDYLRKNPKRLAQGNVLNEKTIEISPIIESKSVSGVIDTNKGDEDIVKYADKTITWQKNVNVNQANTTDAIRVNINGEFHKVDGHDVKFDPSPHEREVADLLSKALGKEVILQPKISGRLRNVSWPDYLIEGQRWDLKELLNGKSENLLRDIVHKKKEQADNFVFDITNSILSEEEVIKRAEDLFDCNNTQHLKTVVIIKDGIIIKVFERL